MKAKYALKALIHMAQHPSDAVRSRQIAEDENIPQKFLDNILQDLRNHGVIEAKRGIFGGYFLARPADDIRIGDVIRIIDGPLAPIRCASLTAYEKCDDCRDEATCQLRKLMFDVRNAMSSVLDQRCLQDLIDAAA
jgi:Rrf2 family protein